MANAYISPLLVEAKYMTNSLLQESLPEYFLVDFLINDYVPNS